DAPPTVDVADETPRPTAPIRVESDAPRDVVVTLPPDVAPDAVESVATARDTTPARNDVDAVDAAPFLSVLDAMTQPNPTIEADAPTSRAPQPATLDPSGEEAPAPSPETLKTDGDILDLFTAPAGNAAPAAPEASFDAGRTILQSAGLPDAVPTAPRFDLQAAADRPEVSMLSNVFTAPPEDVAAVSIFDGTTIAANAAIAALAAVQPEGLFSGDVTPPPAYERVGAIASTQLAYSHWDVDMPFAGNVAKVRNAVTATVTEVDESADLAVVGGWLRDGVIIYALNGEPLLPDMSFATHILQALRVDPDGYTRATVRYRDPVEGRIDRGLLAVPVVRTIGLVDGTQLEARVENLVGVVRVASPGPNADLREGDIIARELSTGTEISSHEDVDTFFNRLVAANAEEARLQVLRNGARLEVTLPLARE
ncbi:MAG: hypothetical protein AAF762_13270, partial [Pseudomonadota bacterium]